MLMPILSSPDPPLALRHLAENTTAAAAATTGAPAAAPAATTITTTTRSIVPCGCTGWTVKLLALVVLQLQEDHVAGHEDTFTAAEKCRQRLVIKHRSAVGGRVGVGDMLLRMVVVWRASPSSRAVWYCSRWASSHAAGGAAASVM